MCRVILLAPLLVALALALAGSIIVTATIGPVGIPPLDVWRIIVAHMVGTRSGSSLADDNIVWLIRFPRVLLAAVVGAGLAVVGTAMQAAVRNPLADPYVLGLSSGASVGAVSVILWGVAVFGTYSLAVAAFLGALISFALVFVLAQRGGQMVATRLVLAGVSVSYIGSAITSFLIFRAQNAAEVQSVLFWLEGSLAGAEWSYLTLPAIVVLAGTLCLLLLARPMNALLAGDETASTLGVDPNRFRKILVALAALLTGTMVAVSGGIGFVGLMLPHIIRLVVGSDHRRVLPVACLVGAIFLVWVDVLARVIVAPEELPIGIITSAIGAPFFLFLLVSNRR
jgi:iron complex transport system permease protein